MIVWGGCAFSGCGDQRNDGGRYDPVTDSWTGVSTVGAPAKRAFHTAVWSGTEMIVFGGLPLSSAGGRYSPSSDSWTPTALAGAPSPRDFHTAVWSGDRMIVWGGEDALSALATGGLYDPARDSWQPISTSSAPAGRRSHTAVWTGSEMIIWGGCGDALCASQRITGGRYDPARNAWTPTTNGAFVPFERGSHTAVWTGDEMMVWGGYRGTASRSTNTGSSYCASAVAVEAPGEATGLLIEPAGGGALRLSWGPSCEGEAADYAVYRGTLGSFYDHSPLLCSTGGASESVVIPSFVNEYYLVVPLGQSVEGRYGADSSGGERPRAADSCRPSQNLAACPSAQP